MDKIQIISVDVQRKQLVLVKFSNNEEHFIDRKTFTESPYSIDSALTTDELSALLSLSKKNRVKDKALWYLSQRDYSVKELKMKLLNESDEETVLPIIERFLELNILNDERFAELLSREYCLIRKYPVRRSIDKMVEKGISRELARETVENLETDDVASALAFLNKKCYNSSLEWKEKQRLFRSLLSKGFAYEDIRVAMHKIEESEEDNS